MDLIDTNGTASSSKSTNTSAPIGTARAGEPLIGTGKTVINDGVVAKVAGLAAREVAGVHALGGGAARALGAIREAMNSTDVSQGVSVEVGETQVAVDVTIVAEYPVPLQQVASDIRSNVIRAIEDLVGLEVTEVNVTIVDIHLPSDDAAVETEPTKAALR
ncbi:Asp23/Gls24 family envelope stress response protein [Cryobacterium glaciale]|uniref:Asp23/Gls24 family envelope stress response protein n=1 Tax=Cryobacterium glaciale TaxID=1259145 RepID=A0A4R8V2B3_9MICO|nr:Asp23/Gls24 family envelope stress response protein [Cryobacterium glaciale]TFB75901.1 Asp23/Gls24 family envelope stress response protein [Cryobacterium glaciale]